MRFSDLSVIRVLSVLVGAWSAFQSPILASAETTTANCPAVHKGKYSPVRPETERYDFDMPGMKISSLSDPTLSTGATLFYFPKGATANFDARGGSVAAVETTLLEEGSYGNSIDGITFAGGSTMGLDAAQGVRNRLFKKRSSQAADWDFIPSVPGAVVYDYGTRLEPTQSALVYPDHHLGSALYDTAAENSMLVGRAGAGTSSTAGKMAQPVWGGQGAAYNEIEVGRGLKVKIFTAVVLNALGEITLPPGTVLNPEALKELRQAAIPRGPKKNTTLSIVVVDASLDRSQLKRLAVTVHTSMARMIHPFSTSEDGDILFAVSLNANKLPDGFNQSYVIEQAIQRESSDLMSHAILRSVTTANTGKTRAPRN